MECLREREKKELIPFLGRLARPLDPSCIYKHRAAEQEALSLLDGEEWLRALLYRSAPRRPSLLCIQ